MFFKKKSKKEIKCRKFYKRETMKVNFGTEFEVAQVGKFSISDFHIGKEIINKVDKQLQDVDDYLYGKCMEIKDEHKTIEDQKYKEFSLKRGRIRDQIFLLRLAKDYIKDDPETAKKKMRDALERMEHIINAYNMADNVMIETREKGVSEQISPYGQVRFSGQESMKHAKQIQKLQETDAEEGDGGEESMYPRKQLLQFASTLFYTNSYEESLETYEKLLSQDSEDFLTLVNSGSVLFHIEGKLQEAEARLNKARNLYLAYDQNQKQEHQETYGICLQWLGIVKRSQGYYDVARDLHNEALKISKTVKNRPLEAHAIANLGAVVLWENKLFSPSKVNDYWKQSLEISKEIRDVYWEVHYGIDVGYMRFLEGKDKPVQEQIKIFKEALEILEFYTEHAKRKKYKEHMARGPMNQASVHFVLDEDSDQALRLYDEALKQAEELKTARLVWRIHHNIGNIYRKSEEFSKAESEYEKAIESIEEMIRGKVETEKKKFLNRRTDPFRSRLLLELDQGRKDQAVKMAKEYKNKFTLDFLGETEEQIDPKKLMFDSPNFINGYYILTE